MHGFRLKNEHTNGTVIILWAIDADVPSLYIRLVKRDWSILVTFKHTSLDQASARSTSSFYLSLLFSNWMLLKAEIESEDYKDFNMNLIKIGSR